MPNITISLDEDLLRSGRRYAEKHQTSMNALIRRLLEQTVRADAHNWQEEGFRLMDQAGGDSRGRAWKREDLYDI